MQKNRAYTDDSSHMLCIHIIFISLSVLFFGKDRRIKRQKQLSQRSAPAIPGVDRRLGLSASAPGKVCIRQMTEKIAKASVFSRPSGVRLFNKIANKHSKNICRKKSRVSIRSIRHSAASHTFICTKCDGGKLCLITKLCYKKCAENGERSKRESLICSPSSSSSSSSPAIVDAAK